MLFTVPDYYPEFRCKMGACRHACCEGWPVSMSMSDYFRLLGEDCSPELRRRMDTALHVHKYATPEEYAFIAPRWDGNCPLRHEDGRCALQVECGEEALAWVCRLYPRGIRTDGVMEASCAASCEKVVEMFLSHPAPIKFINTELDIPLPPQILSAVTDSEPGDEQENMLRYIGIMQNREMPLHHRLMHLWQTMSGNESGSDIVYRPITGSHLEKALCVARKVLTYAETHSSSVHDYGMEALNYFSSSVNKYETAINKMNRSFPEWEIVFEHLMVNHMFFERWPFHDGLKTDHERFAALCGVYGILRFLTLGYLAEHPDRESFVDVASAAFRLIEHTSFDLYITSLLEEENYTSTSDLYDFIRL